MHPTRRRIRRPLPSLRGRRVAPRFPCGLFVSEAVLDSSNQDGPSELSLPPKNNHERVCFSLPRNNQLRLSKTLDVPTRGERLANRASNQHEVYAFLSTGSPVRWISMTL